MDDYWADARQALEQGQAIAWDGCHRIYIVMDEGQVAHFSETGYDPMIPVTDVDESLATLQEWLDESCGLQFVSAVSTSTTGDPNDGFVDVIPQGVLWEDD